MNNTSLISTVESLILGSQTLTLKDKQKLLAQLSSFDETNLTKIKQIFEQEKNAMEDLQQKEISAWGAAQKKLLNLIPKHG